MKSFLISCTARSGSKYTAHVFQKLGYYVTHEKTSPEQIGSVSPKHLWSLIGNRFSPKVQQTRNPLKVVGSLMGVRKYQPQSYIDYMMRKIGMNIKHLRFENDLDACAGWYVISNTVMEKYCTYRYRVEDIDRDYPELFQHLGLTIPSELPSIPTDTNTGNAHEQHRPPVNVNWEMIEAKSSYFNELKEMSKRYGY